MATMKFKSGIETWLTLQFRNTASGFLGIFGHSNTADRTYTLPNKSGTLATLDDIVGGGGGISLSSPLTGYVLGTDGSALGDTDPILSAFEKLQVQLNAVQTLTAGVAYNTTIGDGTSTTIVVTHNLNVDDYGVEVWELVSPYRKVDDAIEIQKTSATQITLIFNTAPATNSLRVNVYTNVANNVANLNTTGDRLSPILFSEIAITTTANLTAGYWNKCTAASANYTVTLPTAASSAGKIVGIRIDPSSTYLVTVQGNGAELIDGSNTRIMWAKEIAELKSDGTSWTKIAGKTIPMITTYGRSSTAQTFSPATTTKLTNLTVVKTSNAPSAFLTSSRFTIVRPGQYYTGFTLHSNNTNSNANQTQIEMYKNGAVSFGTQVFQPAATTRMLLSVNTILNLALNDYLELYGYFTTGAFTTNFLMDDSSDNSRNAWYIQEIPSW